MSLDQQTELRVDGGGTNMDGRPQPHAQRRHKGPPKTFPLGAHRSRSHERICGWIIINTDIPSVKNIGEHLCRSFLRQLNNFDNAWMSKLLKVNADIHGAERPPAAFVEFAPPLEADIRVG